MFNARTMFYLFRTFPDWNWDEAKRDVRRRISQATDPMEIPLRRPYSEINKTPWKKRYHAPHGETWDEYCIITDEQFTDEDLREIRESYWEHICSPYDCTGQIFTLSFKAIRIPCGTLFIHTKGIDL